MQAPLMVGQLRYDNTSSEAGFLLSTAKLVSAKILLSVQAYEFLSKLIGSRFKTSYTLVT